MSYVAEEIEGGRICWYQGIPLVSILPDGRVLINTDQKRSDEIEDVMNRMLQKCGKNIQVKDGQIRNSNNQWLQIEDGMVIE